MTAEGRGQLRTSKRLDLQNNKGELAHTINSTSKPRTIEIYEGLTNIGTIELRRTTKKEAPGYHIKFLDGEIYFIDPTEMSSMVIENHQKGWKQIIPNTAETEFILTSMGPTNYQLRGRILELKEDKKDPAKKSTKFEFSIQKNGRKAYEQLIQNESSYKEIT